MRRACVRKRAVWVAVAAAGVASSILFACVGQDYAPSSSAEPLGNDVLAPDATDASEADAPVNQNCSTGMPFVSVLPLGGSINTSNNDEYGATLTTDETTIIFTRWDGNTDQIYMATRASRGDDFGPPKIVDLSCAPACDNNYPQLAATDDAMVFASDRGGGTSQIYHATRAGNGFTDINLFFSDPPYDDDNPFLSNAGELFFVSTHNTTNTSAYFIFRSLKTADGSFGPAEVFPGFAASGGPSDDSPVLSRDALTMYFASTYPNTNSQPYHTFVMQRPTTADAFGNPAAVTELKSSNQVEEKPDWLSADGCRLYFHRDIQGSYDLYMASKL